MAEQRIATARLLEPVELAAADTVHVPDGVQIFGVYEVPKGARFAYLVVDRSALRASARR